MKFIHAGDLHIDSALAGLSSYPDAPIDLLRTATRSAFSALIDRAIEEKIAFIVIPGDLYDGDWNDWNTGHFFIREMLRLKTAGIDAFVLRGNHDAENEMTKKLPMPDNVRIFGCAKPETFVLDCGDVKVALHGQSFKRADTTDNLVPAYPDPLPGHINIGVLHTALEGHARHATYAPCSLDELKNKGYDYWALGHVHQHAILCEAPWIAYSGNLQGRHIREPGARGALLVTCEHGELRQPERLLVDVVRWSVATVDISSAATREEVVVLVGAEFRRIVDEEAGGRPVACRVVLTGHSPAHGVLFGQERVLRADLIAQAQIAVGDNLWIEKIRVQSLPALDPATVAARGDAVAYLQGLLSVAARDPDFLARLAAEFGPLLAKMPHELFKQDVPALHAVQRGDFASIVAEVAPSLLDRIDRMVQQD